MAEIGVKEREELSRPAAAPPDLVVLCRLPPFSASFWASPPLEQPSPSRAARFGSPLSATVSFLSAIMAPLSPP